jgi:hypothetical protein
MRLHAEQINNAAIRAEFAQANTAIQANSIKQTLSDAADRLMMTDEAYKAMELELRDLLTLIAQRVGLERPTARRNAQITFETYRSALKNRGMIEMLSKLDSILQNRKGLRKTLRKKYTK